MGRAKNKSFPFHFIDLGNEIFLMTVVNTSGKICSVSCPSIFLVAKQYSPLGVFLFEGLLYRHPEIWRNPDLPL